MTDGSQALDPGLRERFRAAGAQVSWREVDPPKPRATARATRAPVAARSKDRRSRTRIAHLNDEEARVEESSVGSTTTWVVDSGPVGALVILLEFERRGPPALLRTHDADPSSAFPQGAIEARWIEGATRPEYSLPIGDLIQFARFALA
ncbi:MAG: hypothetical protein L3J95_03935 [Thermoplasmata archaeon]|nr:hypothetical protein [Thermoplasmata archaeon]MCI4359558.1 hypothetical protein [Thermoplasmata archaeon]